MHLFATSFDLTHGFGYVRCNGHNTILHRQYHADIGSRWQTFNSQIIRIDSSLQRRLRIFTIQEILIVHVLMTIYFRPKTRTLWLCNAQLICRSALLCCNN